MNSDTLDREQQLPELSGMISKIMEHPELISMVASVLGSPSPEGTAEHTTEMAGADEAEKIGTDVAVAATAPVSAPPDMLTSLMPMITKLSSLGQNGSPPFKHEQLLCAMKPYLSSSRREAIDYIIKISKMSSLIKGIK